MIVGDANLSEVATFLKVGTTAHRAVHDRGRLPAPGPRASPRPVQALRQVSYDLDAARAARAGRRLDRSPPSRSSGSSSTGPASTPKPSGLECVGEEVGAEVLRRWEAVLTGLETDPMSLADQLDWVAKYRLLDGYRERHGLDWDDARLAAMDLQYHDLRPEKSLFARLGLERLVADDEVERAITEPPADTRAYFRGKCLPKWADAIVAANWDSLVFDIGGDPLRRVPMMEPTRGTEAHVGTLLDECYDRGRAAGAAGVVKDEKDDTMAEREQKKKPAPARQEEVVEEAPADVRVGREDQGRARRSPGRDRRGARDQRRGLREVLRAEGRGMI